jgi:5-methyltetrahydropteroyltriglutamate--homocysteine methyltransferase
VKAFVPGIYPRSEALVQATRDLDRARTTKEAVDEQVARDFEQFVSVQQDAGVDLLADGMLTWQDLFRPFLSEADGLATGALTRFLDTNTFYRAPHVENGQPQLEKPLDERYVAPLSGPRLVTLPSPFALSLGSGSSPKDLAEAVLKPELDSLDAELVVLSEPFLARAEDPNVDGLGEALEALAGGPPLALQLTFGDASPLLRRGITELPVDGIGIDFYSTSAGDLPKSIDKLLLAGVVDARSSLLEDPREIASFATELARRAADVALVPNGDLQYVSEPLAREKVARLGQAKTTAAREAA